MNKPCKYIGTGIWAGRCKGTKELDPCPGYDKCKQYKPSYMTNADRIRAMSDEELADFLVSVERRRRWDGGGAIWGLPYVAFDWLKQPAEE